MHVCVAQAPAGKNDWSTNEQSVSKQTGLGGAVWADDLQLRKPPPSIKTSQHYYSRCEKS
jgi:hypothetical protein